MPQHKCATCRYFLPSGASNSGQCSHPARQALSGLVMVRAQELACRRGPNDDDWAARGQTSEAATTPKGQIANSRPLVVQSADDVEAAEGAGVYSKPAPALANTVPVVAEDQQANSARQRQGFQGVTVAVQSMELAGVPPRRELNTDGIPIVRKRSTQVSAAHRAAQERRERELQRRHQLALSAAKEETPIAVGMTLDESSLRSELSSADRESSARQAGQAAGRESISQQSEYRGRPADQRQSTAQYPAPPAGRVATAGEPPSDLEPSEAVAEPSPSSLSTPPTSPLTGSDLLVAWEEEWRQERMAECPERRCGSCRDYRVSDNLERGWCGNPFAHSHRQLVHSDDLACLSAVGNWWTASDQRWLDKSGPSVSVPTPMADGLIQLLRMKRAAR